MDALTLGFIGEFESGKHPIMYLPILIGRMKICNESFGIEMSVNSHKVSRKVLLSHRAASELTADGFVESYDTKLIRCIFKTQT